ncbi:MAG: cupredoxin domain-containing protein [Actinomycetota bacterium]
MRRSIAAVAVSTVAAATLVASAAPAAGGATPAARVKARDNAFKPRTITVERGTRVRWVNRGSNPHTTTSTKGQWDKDIPVGGSAGKVFRKRGTFRYICTIHVDQGMRGKVVVV